MTSRRFVDLPAENSLNIPACCQALPGFDSASGLGAPLFDRLSAYVDRGLVE